MRLIKKNSMRKKILCKNYKCIIRFDPNFLPSSQRGRLYVMCDEGTVTSVTRVAAQQAGYFENFFFYIMFFWAIFIMYSI